MPDPAKSVTTSFPAEGDKDATLDARVDPLAPAMRNLLKAIRAKEAGSAGYNADYRNDDKWVLTTKTFDQVRDLGRSQVTQQHEASSAIGAYQFLTATLDSLKIGLKLKGTERFDEQFQDALAVALMRRRGLDGYMAGTISLTTFCNNLAKEWASLPVVSTIQGQRRTVQPGQSYYAGDGLNRAGHTAEEILGLVRSLK